MTIRSVKPSAARKTTAQVREERHRNSFATVESKGADDGGGSEEQSKAAARMYSTAAASSRGDTGSEGLGDPALRKR
jgi:hypothetical protein